ncbi:MAG: LysM peptidoglycan-binding domain-containing protein [Chloroflexota bacterium]
MDNSQSTDEEIFRCPYCDAVVPSDQSICLMCGMAVSHPKPTPPQLEAIPEPESSPPEGDAPTVDAPEVDSSQTVPVVEPTPAPVLVPSTDSINDDQVIASILRERPANVVQWITALFFVLLAGIGFLILRYQEPIVVAQVVETVTPAQPTATMTATQTAVFTETPAPTLTPTITLTPAPTETPRPPRIHVIASGETLIGISLLFDVSPDSIAELNGFEVDSQVQVNQNIFVPWPTATPPFEVLALEVNGATVVLDPRGCEQIEVQSGDSLVGIASRYGINFDWLAQVNRINNPELLQPGDVVCIPEVLYDADGVIPPTPGPSPTPTATSLPPGPQLLFPANSASFTGEVPPALQWLAVQNLNEDEQYMVEVRNESSVEGIILRAFTKNTGFQLPANWRPTEESAFEFSWRVAIVTVTNYRSDGLPIYTVGGQFSNSSTFTWQGAVPTSTPIPTNTAVPTATSTSAP